MVENSVSKWMASSSNSFGLRLEKDFTSPPELAAKSGDEKSLCIALSSGQPRYLLCYDDSKGSGRKIRDLVS